MIFSYETTTILINNHNYLINSYSLVKKTLVLILKTCYWLSYNDLLDSRRYFELMTLNESSKRNIKFA